MGCHFKKEIIPPDKYAERGSRTWLEPTQKRAAYAALHRIGLLADSVLPDRKNFLLAGAMTKILLENFGEHKDVDLIFDITIGYQCCGDLYEATWYQNGRECKTSKPERVLLAAVERLISRHKHDHLRRKLLTGVKLALLKDKISANWYNTIFKKRDRRRYPKIHLGFWIDMPDCISGDTPPIGK